MQPRAASHLTVRRVTKRFSNRAVLSDVELTARTGEFVAIVGKSGCGKTTLLRLIAGLDSPTEGEIRVDGEAPRHGQHGVRMTFQEARLLPWLRVADNIGIGQPGDELHRRAATEALARVGLAGRGADWPGVLSGGERQRVALARALVSRPGLLLMDEPLGALDALTRLEMQQLLERIWLETPFTAVLVTHDVEEAVALADRVVSLEQGQIALELAVTLPRPRNRHSHAFTNLVTTVLGQLMGARSPGDRAAVPGQAPGRLIGLAGGLSR